MFGDCCIPCLLLMLGATLSKGPGKACPPLRVVAAVGAARLVLLPLLGTGWLVLAKTLGAHMHCCHMVQPFGYVGTHCMHDTVWDCLAAASQVHKCSVTVCM